MREDVLEGHLVVGEGVLGDSGLYLFGLGVVAEEAVLAEVRGDAPHAEENAAVLFLSLDDPALGKGRDRLGDVLDGRTVGGGVGSVPGEGLNVFEFVEELEVGLVDMQVIFVKSVSEGATLVVLDVLQVEVASVVDVQHLLTLLPDAL
jgi:hypothetical protein